MIRCQAWAGAEKHDARTADALLDAAERIILEGGIDALSVRTVAARVGTTTRAVYSLFGSKERLMAALGVRAFEMLGAGVAALPTTADPAADLVAAGYDGVSPLCGRAPRAVSHRDATWAGVARVAR